MNVTVVYESWRPHPLAWIHRSEARAIAAELRRSGRTVDLVRWRSSLPRGPLLLRLSDPLMFAAAQEMERASIPFLGPRAAVLERCYDKHEAHRIAAANGVDSPATALASVAVDMPYPLILKPRQGSDSIGVRLLRRGPIPAALRCEHYLAQEYIRGEELTVAVLHGRVGTPLAIRLPAETPYSFLRKYLLRPPQPPVDDSSLAERARLTARRVAGIFGVNWAARIDLIHETASGRLCLLECDVAPLVGPASAFAASLSAKACRARSSRDCCSKVESAATTGDLLLAASY